MNLSEVSKEKSLNIRITEKQAHQFNLMLKTLRKISKDYMTPDKLRRSSQRMYGLDFEECIEMAYENIQNDAAFASKGIKEITFELKLSEPTIVKETEL